MPVLTDKIVRGLLLKTWGHQACQVRPDEWPEVLARLMKPRGASPGTEQNNQGRGGLRDAVDEGVVALTAAFADGPPADPVEAVKVAFFRLDAAHRVELAAALTTASGGGP